MFYSATVTVFNFYESSAGAMWYPHVIHGADLITDKGAILKKYGPDSTDSAELHITYTDTEQGRVIVDGLTYEPVMNAAGNPLIWLPPKEWAKQVNDLYDDTLTFDTTDDFFWLGEWSGGVVNDADYTDRRTEGFYAYMVSNYDYVYRITTVGGPYTVIPHFEILGA